MKTLSVLLSTSRPLSWINTAYPFAVVYWLLTRQIDATLVVGTLFFLIPYNLMMYGINDVFDYESDLRNPRKGGVEGALVGRHHHRSILWAAGISTAIPALALVLMNSWFSSVVLVIVLFAVYAYSAPGLRFKEVPFLDSATSATHFVGPAVYAVALAAGRVGGEVLTAPLAAILVAFFAWSMASQAFGAVQDIVPDREAGLASIATVIGARWTVRVAAIGYVLASVCLLLGALLAGEEAPALRGALTIASIAPLVYALSVSPWWSVSDAESETSHAGWSRFLWLNYVVGFALSMLIIVTVRYFS